MSRSKVIQEISEYLTVEPNLLRSDRQIYLQQIIDREFFERKNTHVINRFDLLQIISNGGTRISKMKMPIQISNKDIEQNDVRHVAMIESIIGYLNRHGLLNREVNFDYTTSEYDLEPIED